MSDNKFHPANPTVPVPDQFGQISVFFGFSKVEQATIQLLSGMLANQFSLDSLQVSDHHLTINQSFLIETAYKIAESAIEYCEKKALESVEESKIIK